MTFVVASSGDGQVAVRSDFLVTRFSAEGGPVVGHSPLPKLLIPDPSLVVGIAGPDPQGAIGNVLRMWGRCKNVDGLRVEISTDGYDRREYLIATSDGRLFAWDRPRGWRESDYGQVRIGSQEAFELHQPDPFDWKVSALDDATKAGMAETARQMGFTAEAIEDVLSGRVEKELGPQLRFDTALRAQLSGVGGLMVEAHLIDGRFVFSQQAEVIVAPGGPAVLTDEDADRCLLGHSTGVSHRMFQANEKYPAALVVEFTRTGAQVVFSPGADGYLRTFRAPR